MGCIMQAGRHAGRLGRHEDRETCMQIEAGGQRGVYHFILCSLYLLSVLFGFSISVSRINGRCCFEIVSPSIILRNLNSLFAPEDNQSLTAVYPTPVQPSLRHW